MNINSLKRIDICVFYFIYKNTFKPLKRCFSNFYLSYCLSKITASILLFFRQRRVNCFEIQNTHYKKKVYKYVTIL